MVNLFTHLAQQDAMYAHVDAMEADFGTDWQERVDSGERFLSERDFPIAEDVDVSAEDWEAMAEAMWVDPAERHW